MIFNFFNHLNNCILTLPLYICDINSHYWVLFVEYLPEDGRKTSKHVGGLPHICMLLYPIIEQLLEYIW